MAITLVGYLLMVTSMPGESPVEGFAVTRSCFQD